MAWRTLKHCRYLNQIDMKNRWFINQKKKLTTTHFFKAIFITLYRIEFFVFAIFFLSVRGRRRLKLKKKVNYELDLSKNKNKSELQKNVNEQR